MLYRKEANSRDRKSNIEKGGGGSIVEIRKEICLKYSNMTKCLNTFVAHCRFVTIIVPKFYISVLIFYVLNYQNRIQVLSFKECKCGVS